MTREEKLYTLPGQALIEEADKLGVKVACNKTRTSLKEAKAKVITRILEAEAKIAETEEPAENQLEQPESIENDNIQDETENSSLDESEVQDDAPVERLKPMPGTEGPNWGKEHWGQKETKEQSKPKRGALIEFDGKAQNICAWGEELGISPNTLYGRIYKMGWSVERAFTTPSSKTK